MNLRNTNIDLLKVILASLVIVAHLLPTNDFDSKTGIFYYFFSSFVRLTVPIFLLISGYYLRKNIAQKAYLIAYGTKILKLFIVWQLLYVPIVIDLFVKKQFDLNRVLYDSFFGIGHLWYLCAILLATFLLYLTRNFKTSNKFLLALIVIAVGCIFQFLIESKQIKNEQLLFINKYMGTTRNFLFYAFPYMLLGTIYEYWAWFVNKYKNFFIPLLLILLLEIKIYFDLHIPPVNLFILTGPLSMIILVNFINKQNHINIKINTHLSLGIYLIHFYPVYYIILTTADNSLLFMLYKYAFVYCVTLLIWFVMEKINRKFALFF